MLKLFLKLILVFTLFLISSVAFGTEVPGEVATLPSVFTDLLELFKMIKGGTVGILTIISAGLALTLQIFKLKILKPFITENKTIIFTVTTIFGVGISIITLMIGGMPFWDAFIAGGVTTGGAVAIYNAVRALFKK